MNLVSGNRITLLKNGAEFFPSLEAAIDAALEDIRLETYIFEEDRSGIRIANALMRAVSRGVSVRVLVDGFGSRQTSMHFFNQMRKVGVTVLFFRPERGWFDFAKSRVRRVHRKIALVDTHIGFVGGINLIDDFTNNALGSLPRYDYAVKIEGPIIADIYTSVYRLWRLVSWFNLKRRGVGFEIPLTLKTAVGSATLAFVVRDNFRHRRDIEREYWQSTATIAPAL
ncbi:MAG: phospholipase D-like domain-containing protein, partial [Pseudomonadota bacterium]